MDDNAFSAEDADSMRAYMPTSFGKQNASVDVQAQIENHRRKIVDESKPPPKIKSADSDDESSAEDDDDSDEDDEDEFPVSHELMVKTHQRAVTSITLDPSGTRLVTGSTDCTIKLHDLSAMTPTTIRAFKTVDPFVTKASEASESHAIHQVLFSPHSGNQMLVITATAQARLFSRDGEMIAEYKKGDMYLRDKNNTKGHTAEITSAAWCPTNRNLFVTAAHDSTVRIWDVNDRLQQKHVMVHKSKAAGSAGMTRMTAIAWGHAAEGQGSIIVAAGFDGSLVMWGGEGPFYRPIGEIREAHAKDTWTSGLDISNDGRLVITRGGDDTIKLWDTRKFKAPVNTTSFPSTSSQYPTSNIIFSPGSANVVTGSETGHLHILNPATLRPELITPVTPGSPLISVHWHPKIKQICTGSANGQTTILFNPQMSTNGALSVLSKAPKKRHMDDDPNLTTFMDPTGIAGDAVTPGGVPGPTAGSFSSRHPTIGLTASGRSRDPRRPHKPEQTPFAMSTPDQRHVRENIPFSSMRDEDPVEALLKYQPKEGEEKLFTGAWDKTQPKAIFKEDFSDEEEPDPKRMKKG
ncbi:WD40 repeat-like protein [Polyplosphaeria fusca]|uniref:WD40 repeat-like protein n=1 Tax=Polyplosphaeria fusca TaxID=682080 RepID=A0A9P4R4C6_9PLEO|nr:WD40 repeat-like protein [Polyplosphaeria fusca]